jgi:putative ABC transport system permease protein
MLPNDLRYAARSLRRNPGFALVAVLTLALGIGATTAIFAVIDAVMLRPLPFAQPERLVHVWETTPEGEVFTAADPNYLDLRDRNRTFEAMAAYKQAALSLTGHGDARRLEGMAVTHSLFPLLGVRPALGRTFLPEEDSPGGDTRVALLGHALWQDQFGGDPAIVGSTITLDRQPYTVTGVMPEGFEYPGAELWIPLAPDPARERDDHWLWIVGRLRPDVTLAAAQGDLQSIARSYGEQHPVIGGWGIRLESMSERIVGPGFRQTMLVLLGGVGGLLLIGCLNLANLLLARATARQTEIGIRSALGAGRSRIARQLLTESLLLAALGSAAGLVVAAWAIGTLRGLAPGWVPRLDEVAIDWRVMAFAFGLGLATSLLFGLAPAVRASRVELAQTLRQGGRSVSPSHRRLRNGLVVVQVALATALLVSAGLLMRSFMRLQAADPGFDAAGVVAVPIQFDEAAYGEAWRRVVFLDQLVERIEAVPGVVAAGASAVDPFSGWNLSNDVTPAERAAEVGASGYVQAGWRAVTPGFFSAMRIPLLRGRTFTGADPYDGPVIGVVTAALAERLWPGEDPVGKQLFRGGVDGEPLTVIGVVGDYHDVNIGGDPPLILFIPNNQMAWPSMTLLVRSALDGPAVAAAVREQIRALDPNLPVPEIRPLERSVSAAVAGPRFRSVLLGAFAAIALILAAVGVYGVASFGVARRIREFGVRLALGATPADVSGMVLRSGLALAAAGVALGIVAAWGLSRFLSTLLYDLSPTDPGTFAAVALLLGAVTVLATYLPGRRASRVDPVVALRDE